MGDTASLLAEALDAIAQASDERSLDGLRVQYLGKKGSFTDLLKGLGKLPAEERPAAGENINKAKQELQAAIEQRKSALVHAALDARLQEEKIDVTLPGRRQGKGGLHPITITIERIKNIFAAAGYEVA